MNLRQDHCCHTPHGRANGGSGPVRHRSWLQCGSEVLHRVKRVKPSFVMASSWLEALRGVQQCPVLNSTQLSRPPSQAGGTGNWWPPEEHQCEGCGTQGPHQRMLSQTVPQHPPTPWGAHKGLGRHRGVGQGRQLNGGQHPRSCCHTHPSRSEGGEARDPTGGEWGCCRAASVRVQPNRSRESQTVDLLRWMSWPAL